jgi:PHAX RNA-binding domain
MSEDIENRPEPTETQVGSPEATKEASPSPEEQRARRKQQAETVQTLAAQLDEQERAALQVVVKALGPEIALALLQETLSVEANGGMMLPDGSRRRTPGGVFFFLAKTHWTEARMALARYNASKNALSGNAPSANHATGPTPAQPAAPSFRWEARIAVLAQIGNEKGSANVKMTVIGRPGKIVDKGTCVLTVVQSTKVPALPKGLPTPSSATTTYAVYIASKQWKKVAEAIQDPEDLLILEGFPQLDSQTGSIAVFVSNATTKNLQKAQKQAQQGETPS